MRTMRVLTLFIGLLLTGLLFSGGSAQAGDLCPSDESVLKSSKSDPPFQCAVHSWSSKKSIAAWDTKSWSSDTALGYEVKSKCAYRSSGDVSWVWTAAGPSYSATFTNWADGTRHFGTGVVFTTGGVDDDQIKSDSNCATGDGKITNAITKLTEKVTIDSVEGSQYWGQTLMVKGSVSPSGATGYVALLAYGETLTYGGQPVAAPIVDGKFSIPWKTTSGLPTAPVVLTAAYPGDTSKCPAAAKSCGWTGGQSQNVTVNMKFTYETKPVDDLNSVNLAAASKSVRLASSPKVSFVGAGGAEAGASSTTANLGIKTKSASSTMPGKLGMRCPKGTFPLNSEVYGARSTVIQDGTEGSRVRPGAVEKGKVSLQLSCREKRQPVAHSGRVSFGTASADRIKSRKAAGVMFGGPGDDHLKVATKNSVAFGGKGADRIIISAANGVAVGGSGNDRIESSTSGRTLLIGGAGQDRILASGKARVNARDGERDHIRCKGGKVKVKADSIDHVDRNCQRA